MGAGASSCRGGVRRGYFARKVIGVGRLVAVWRWADKLQRATAEELRWAPNEMARSAARVHQQEADRYVKRCEAEESEYCLRTGKTPRTDTSNISIIFD